jgi:signal transduction histidine kinase
MILNVQINNLLDFNLLQKNKFHVNLSKINIRELIEMIVETMRPQAGMSRVNLIVIVTQEVPKMVEIDDNRF